MKKLSFFSRFRFHGLILPECGQIDATRVLAYELYSDSSRLSTTQFVKSYVGKTNGQSNLNVIFISDYDVMFNSSQPTISPHHRLAKLVPALS